MTETNQDLKLKSVELIQQEVEKLINSSKEKLENVKRFAIEEAWKILQLATASVIQIIEAIGNDLAGPEKKALAMQLLTKFYDQVFSVVDIPMIPNFMEPLLHSYIKSFLMVLVSASIDALVTTFRNTGVFLSKYKK